MPRPVTVPVPGDGAGADDGAGDGTDAGNVAEVGNGEAATVRLVAAPSGSGQVVSEMRVDEAKVSFICFNFFLNIYLTNAPSFAKSR